VLSIHQAIRKHDQRLTALEAEHERLRKLYSEDCDQRITESVESSAFNIEFNVFLGFFDSVEHPEVSVDYLLRLNLIPVFQSCGFYLNPKDRNQMIYDEGVVVNFVRSSIRANSADGTQANPNFDIERSDQVRERFLGALRRTNTLNVYLGHSRFGAGVDFYSSKLKYKRVVPFSEILKSIRYTDLGVRPNLGTAIVSCDSTRYSEKVGIDESLSAPFFSREGIFYAKDAVEEYLNALGALNEQRALPRNIKLDETSFNEYISRASDYVFNDFRPMDLNGPLGDYRYDSRQWIFDHYVESNPKVELARRILRQKNCWFACGSKRESLRDKLIDLSEDSDDRPLPGDLDMLGMKFTDANRARYVEARKRLLNYSISALASKLGWGKDGCTWYNSRGFRVCDRTTIAEFVFGNSHAQKILSHHYQTYLDFQKLYFDYAVDHYLDTYQSLTKIDFLNYVADMRFWTRSTRLAALKEFLNDNLKYFPRLTVEASIRADGKRFRPEKFEETPFALDAVKNLRYVQVGPVNKTKTSEKSQPVDQVEEVLANNEIQLKFEYDVDSETNKVNRSNKKTRKKTSQPDLVPNSLFMSLVRAQISFGQSILNETSDQSAPKEKAKPVSMKSNPNPIQETKEAVKAEPLITELKSDEIVKGVSLRVCSPTEAKESFKGRRRGDKSIVLCMKKICNSNDYEYYFNLSYVDDKKYVGCAYVNPRLSNNSRSGHGRFGNQTSRNSTRYRQSTIVDSAKDGELIDVTRGFFEKFRKIVEERVHSNRKLP
ncbi:MAG: hypothetical protein KDD25_08070, partial [Bdellovibrionales bacterium]|nr:hypothetical protein [Bdellovibrionales bacterium]